MKRREFITLVGGAAIWPLTARAQQQPVHPLIGVLSPLSAALAARNIAGFRSGLRDLGYLEGRDITLALRYGGGAPERMAPLAQELVALKPDVLMIGGARSGALASQAAMRTIPIVIITTDDPVALGGCTQHRQARRQYVGGAKLRLGVKVLGPTRQLHALPRCTIAVRFCYSAPLDPAEFA
jgi:ABC-type uncharacterized transport system substrate-binding protein